jgi:hypothetical protein
VPLQEDRWVSAVEIRPGAREAVHHVAVFNVKPDDVQSILENEGMQSGRNGYWSLMAPGEEPTIHPPGTAKRLRGQSVLIISMHYTSVGRPLTDVTKVGIVSPLTLGIPNWPAQFPFRLSGSRVNFRRLNPKRTSCTAVGLMVTVSEITTCRWLIGMGV